MFTLEKSIGLFVPSTEDHDRPISSVQLDKRVNDTALWLADLFGGYQAFYGGVGGYKAAAGNLISEDSILVVAFCTADAYQDHYARALAYCSLLARIWSQETIALLDNFQQMHLLSESDQIQNVTRVICSFEQYQDILGKSVQNARGYYDSGYTIGLARQESKQSELALV